MWGMPLAFSIFMQSRNDIKKECVIFQITKTWQLDIVFCNLVIKDNQVMKAYLLYFSSFFWTCFVCDKCYPLKKNLMKPNKSYQSGLSFNPISLLLLSSHNSLSVFFLYFSVCQTRPFTFTCLTFNTHNQIYSAFYKTKQNGFLS